MEKDVLFSGVSSEIEILEFMSGGNSYGINVSDIKEILPYDKKCTAVPNSHPFIEGIIMPRDFLITIVNFLASLQLTDIDESKNEMLIVTSIDDFDIAFHVDSVSGIHRAMNSEIEKPGEELSTAQTDFISCIFKLEDRAIEVVEMRNIIKSINPDLKVG